MIAPTSLRAVLCFLIIFNAASRHLASSASLCFVFSMKGYFISGRGAMGQLYVGVPFLNAGSEHDSVEIEFPWLALVSPITVRSLM